MVMGKKRFKIIHITDGESHFYDTKLKTWFGWVSFSVFYKTYILHVFSDPVDKKELAYERIFEYCKANGYKIEDIVIIEANK
jgi:hypothetical protein